MDIHVLDTINKANINIEELIDNVIELKQLNKGRNCCYGSLADRPECKDDCNECQNNYYSKMKEDMLKEYNVSL